MSFQTIATESYVDAAEKRLVSADQELYQDAEGNVYRRRVVAAGLPDRWHVEDRLNGDSFDLTWNENHNRWEGDPRGSTAQLQFHGGTWTIYRSSAFLVDAYNLNVSGESTDENLSFPNVTAQFNDATPGTYAWDPVKKVAYRTDDIYMKSEVIDEVQHYKKLVLEYDSDMEGWGLNFSGDYVINNNEFVEAQ